MCNEVSFFPRHGTNDEIFVVSKFSGRNKQLYSVANDLEKAFDRMLREVIWWALQIKVDKWLVMVE